MRSDFCFLGNILNFIHSKNLDIALNLNNNNFYNPTFFNCYSFDGSTIMLNSHPDEFICKNGIIKARIQFLHALKYAVENLKVKIVLLAASTKRLFGKEIELKVNWDGKVVDNGFTLRELYPDILFTNGDNGTSVILDMEIEDNLKNLKIDKENPIICDCYPKEKKCSGAVIINGLGLLGTNSLKHMVDKHFCDNQVIVISNHTKELDEIIGKSNIAVYSHINEIQNHPCLKISNNVKMIINCTHHPSQIITAESISKIQNGQNIHVIDVAVPYGFPEEEYNKCKNVTRQDGGNAFIEKGLEFYFNPELCGLTENVLYGCFAETVVLSAFLKENPDKEEYLKSFDYFNVNETTKNFVKELFDKNNIGISPKPYNFMKREE
jgi:hypothetical protein